MFFWRQRCALEPREDDPRGDDRGDSGEDDKQTATVPDPDGYK
jgi:hypothetical protein